MKLLLNIIKITLTTILLGIGAINFHGITQLVQPVAKSTEVAGGRDLLRESLIYLQCPRQQILQIKSGIETASSKTGIGGLLLASLLYTESNFKLSAISEKGYRGIAQTPTATMKYAEVDILHGAMILKDKLRLTRGNMYEALALYKGGRNPLARKQAREVIQVYKEVINKIG